MKGFKEQIKKERRRNEMKNGDGKSGNLQKEENIMMMK